MDLTFWTQEWPLIRNAPHLAIGGAIVIALAVWAFVSWAYRRKIAVLKAESGAWEARFTFAHERETVVSQKRNELEATTDHRERNDTGSRRYNAEGYDGSSRIGFRKFGIV
jgi:type VI protein secretion system component VasK